VKLKTKAPQQDPTIAAANAREQARADAAFVSNTQELLTDETKRRNRRFGRRTALAGVTPGGGQLAGGTVSGGAPAGGSLGGYPSLGSLA
jgi:hypothetical protein